jgi:hypothetical protein
VIKSVLPVTRENSFTSAESFMSPSGPTLIEMPSFAAGKMSFDVAADCAVAAAVAVVESCDGFERQLASASADKISVEYMGYLIGVRSWFDQRVATKRASLCGCMVILVASVIRTASASGEWNAEIDASRASFFRCDPTNRAPCRARFRAGLNGGSR